MQTFEPDTDTLFGTKNILRKSDAPERIQQFRDELTQQYSPRTPEEVDCINDLATLQWRIQRAEAYQISELSYLPFLANQRTLGQFQRYEASCRRLYDRILARLTKLQRG